MHTFLLLSIAFFFFSVLVFLCKMNQPTPNYKTLYPWASSDLLEETSKFTTLESIVSYRKSESSHKSRIFDRELDKFVRVVPCRVNESVCCDESSDSEGPFCFIYSTIFKKFFLRLPFANFERALLIEINVAPAQLHPTSWAFVRAFSILCHHFGHLPSLDVFLYFFEAKSPGQKLWVSFNEVVGRVLLTLFQQSYKGFKVKFFKIRCNKNDPTLLDGFPLYWTHKPGLKKSRCLEDLPPREREVCLFLSNLQVVFSSAMLIQREYNLTAFKAYIGIPFPLLLLVFSCLCVYFNSYMLPFSCRHGAGQSEKKTPGCCGHAEENDSRPFC